MKRGETPYSLGNRVPDPVTLNQQLHNYPVGSSGNERAKTTFGNKYNITPVRRELLVDLRAVVVMDGNPELEEAVRRGLSGHGDPNRYGLPFVGDNAFLPDRIDVLSDTPRRSGSRRLPPTTPSCGRGRRG